MSQAPTTPEHRRLERTPQLARALARLRRALVSLLWLEALGWILGAVSLWLLFAFCADYLLRVPYAVRLFHSLVLLALAPVLAWRLGWVRLRRMPDARGLAQLYERSQPAQHESLVSAVEFQQGQGAGAQELVERLLREAETRAGGLRSSSVVAPRRPRLRFAAGLSLMLSLLLAAYLQPAAARIFAQRLLLDDVSWPQRTRLLLEVPLASSSLARASVETVGELVRVKLARGSDLPILVRAEGDFPDEVRLAFDGGSSLVLIGNSGVYRTLLPACQQDLAFEVLGGDDQDGLPRLELAVLTAPELLGIAVRTQPPAYTGLPARLEFDSDLSVPAGSSLYLHVATEPHEVQALVRLLPDNQTLLLAPEPFPAREVAGAASLTAAERPGWGCVLPAEASLRFRIELTDAQGLPNLDPALWTIQVAPDRLPEIEVLSPGRGEFETVAGGLLALRVLASDDYGLRRLGWKLSNSFADAGLEPLQGSGELVSRAWQAPSAPGKPLAAGLLGSARLELAALLGGNAGKINSLTLEVEAADNREPEAQLGHSQELRISILSDTDYLRRVQERLSGARTKALTLESLQHEALERVRDLAATLASDAPLDAGDQLALRAALTGQRRVQSDAQALAQELVFVAQGVLYARLDDQAGALLELLDSSLADSAERQPPTAAWHSLAELTRARNDTGLAAHLVALGDLGLVISEECARPAALALSEAQNSFKAVLLAEALERARQAQISSLERIDELLEKLAEWDNFQSVLSLTRDILERQKSLRERTKSFTQSR